MPSFPEEKLTNAEAKLYQELLADLGNLAGLDFDSLAGHDRSATEAAGVRLPRKVDEIADICLQDEARPRRLVELGERCIHGQGVTTPGLGGREPAVAKLRRGCERLHSVGVHPGHPDDRIDCGANPDDRADNSRHRRP